MIEFTHIHKKYGWIEVLKDIDLRVEWGSCTVFIGPNGCGKTTLLKCLLGMVIPDSGSIAIDGTDVRDYLSRQRLGFMPQIGCFPENMTVSEVVRVILSLRNRMDMPDRELYDAFEIEAVGAKKMNTLSGGTVQKVSAALAFMFDPEIIVMDEPFAGLDLLAADILRRKILQEKQKGKTVLITSHTFSEIEGVVSDVVFMETGVVAFHRPLAELLATTGKANVTDAVMTLLK